MARTDARNIKPSLSESPRDKLAAAFGWHYGQFKESREYRIAPIYFDMLVEWHEKLSAEDKELVFKAAQRADQLLDEGDMAGAETWRRILNAIERLQAKAPAEGEKVH
jgi:hypothetical protein